MLNLFIHPANKICWTLLHLWLFTSSCSFFKPPIALQIGDQKWNQKQLTILLKQKIKDISLQNNLDEKRIKNIKKQLITDLLIQYIITKFAKHQGITISEEAIHTEFKKIQQGYMHPSTFKLYLSRQNINLSEWKRNIKYNLLVQAILKQISLDIASPNEKELKLFYQNNLNNFKKKSRVQIRHIFHTKKDVLLKISELLKTGRKFKTLARQFSKTPELEKAHWAEKGLFQIFDQAFTLKKKQISPIWQSDHGWHIIQVLDKQPGKTLSFEEAKPKITSILIRQRQKAQFTKWLDKQIKKVLVFKNQKVINNIQL